jgi:hypothetical protein
MTDENEIYTHKVFSSRVKLDPHDFVGDNGRIFYNEQTGELRISDGVTPFGHPIFGSGGGGGQTLFLYAENGVPVNPPLASISDSIALGDGSVARAHGAVMQSAGVFAQPGDAQIGDYVARGITTSNQPTEIFLDGVSKRILVQPNMSIAYCITVIARRTDSFSNEGAVYSIQGGIDRSVSYISTRLIGTPTKNVLSEDNPTWDIAVHADQIYGALQIRVTGEHSKTIRWVAHIQTVEVSV